MNRASDPGSQPSFLRTATGVRYRLVGGKGLFLFGLMSMLWGCSEPEVPAQRPNILWVVWDTVRADHMSLYGYDKVTTPFLDRWAQDARVFEDCVSPGTITLTSHGSLFTGLMPAEHGADNGHRRLDQGHDTLAELFRDAGYRTFLWSANPHLSVETQFSQGFSTSLHPWSPQYVDRARGIVQEKIPDHDRSSELPVRMAKQSTGKWDIKASGRLARSALSEWLLEESGASSPYFAFLNYMEAHRPRVPPMEFRERMMTSEQIVQSYQIDQSWDAIWSYTFGTREYSAQELRTMVATYDATVAELDSLFEDLIDHLSSSGLLDNTVVVLTSDHGEHLGEHHLLDHQYSVYDELLRVPLVLYFPDVVEAGREKRPVMSHDLFDTLLELAGIENEQTAPPERARGMSLLQPTADRARLSTYLTPFRTAFRSMKKLDPEWDPAPWKRELRSLTLGDYKLIRRQGHREALYHLPRDRKEQHDLAGADPSTTSRLSQALDRELESIVPWSKEPSGSEPVSRELRERLRVLGYLDAEDDPSETEASQRTP